MHDVVELGIERLVDYQGPAYADLFLQRLDPIVGLEARAGAADFAVTRETARFLALWMSYEDVIRVADLKTRADRLARVRDEVRAATATSFTSRTTSSPVSTNCARSCRRASAVLCCNVPARAVWKIASMSECTSARAGSFGFLLLRLLASLKWWRPHSLRYQDEQRLIERWLAAIARAAPSTSRSRGKSPNAPSS